jgi:hypothetical protein
MKNFKIPIVLFLGCLLWACSPDESEIDLISDQSAGDELLKTNSTPSQFTQLTWEEIQTINQNLEVIVENINSQHTPEEQAVMIESELFVFVQNGYFLVNRALNAYDTDPEGNLLDDTELTEAELAAARNLSNLELGQLGFIYSAAMTAPNSIDTDLVVHCLQNALGLTALGALINDVRGLATFEAIEEFTWKHRKRILKLVGKLTGRFMGWFGFALFVKDFTFCLN